MSGKAQPDERITYLHIKNLFHLHVHLFNCTIIDSRNPLSNVFVIIGSYHWLFISCPVMCLFSSLNSLFPADWVFYFFFQEYFWWYLVCSPCFCLHLFSKKNKQPPPHPFYLFKCPAFHSSLLWPSSSSKAHSLPNPSKSLSHSVGGTEWETTPKPLRCQKHSIVPNPPLATSPTLALWW